MSSVNVIQSAESRQRADTRPAERSDDLFSEILRNTASSRDDRNEAPSDSKRDRSPVAAVPNACSRAEALERNKAARDAMVNKPDSDRTDACASGKPSDMAVEEKDPASPASECSEEADGAEDQPIEAEANPAEERAANTTALEKNAHDPDLEESAEASEETGLAETPNGEKTDATVVEVEAQPEADPDQIEAVTAPEDQASDEVSDEVTQLPVDLPTDMPNNTPKQETPIVAAASAPNDSIPEAVASPVESGGEETPDAPPILPGNSAQAPRGREEAPGQQPVHPNPVAAAARENAPPFADGGNPQQHSQNPHQQNPSQQHDLKPATPAASHPLEFAQPAGPQADTLQPVQFDLNASAALQVVRPVAATAGPASFQPANVADANPVPLTPNAIAVEIVSRMRDGQRRFDIRLDPPELGRIEVRLDVDRNGNVSTRLTVDRPETLDLMQRDARSLERALQQAGLKTDDAGLQFSLRQHAGNPEQDGGGFGRSPDIAASDEGEISGSIVESYRASILARGGVDIRV